MSKRKRKQQQNPSGLVIALGVVGVVVVGVVGLTALGFSRAKKKVNESLDEYDAKRKALEDRSASTAIMLGLGGGASGGLGAAPPNTSDDPAGYSTVMFPNLASVRQVLKILGYSIAQGNQSLTAADRAVIGRFQNDYNKLKDAGVFYPELVADSELGPHTLNGLEHGMAIHKKALSKGSSWTKLVAAANATPQPKPDDTSWKKTWDAFGADCSASVWDDHTFEPHGELTVGARSILKQVISNRLPGTTKLAAPHIDSLGVGAELGVPGINPHSHTISLTNSQIKKISRGEQVVVKTDMGSSWGVFRKTPHQHTIAIQCHSLVPQTHA